MPNYRQASQYAPLEIDGITSMPGPGQTVREFFELLPDGHSSLWLTELRWRKQPYWTGEICEECWLKNGQVKGKSICNCGINEKYPF